MSLKQSQKKGTRERKHLFFLQYLAHAATASRVNTTKKSDRLSLYFFWIHIHLWDQFKTSQLILKYNKDQDL